MPRSTSKEKSLKQTATTAQQLGSLVKSARDIMRKDKGLNGDLDRLPMLTWIMFLKFLDDMEQIREAEAGLRGDKFKPAIESPYRWRDWAAEEEGITGDELIRFVNQEEAVRPDGTKGAGLFAYLRGLQGTNGGDRKDVIATVFKGTVNRMINGYLLRDVINKINGIHFNSSEEIHTLGRLYESMLKEMRDAAGDSGEFYTPRSVVRFMVEVVNPRLGEVVLDPACGTGGFLVECYSHLETQCKTVGDRETLQKRSIFGGEAKSLPYLLAQMNLLLHGMDYPRISAGNSLDVKLSELGDKDRVDIVLTNPPFGGEEERGILSNFPADKQTNETALLFLQLIMRKLRRVPTPGRAGIVVPNGTLAGGGAVGKRVREELLRDFRVTAIIRLPHNVFAPYTDVVTNLVFFDRLGPTKRILYAEVVLPEGMTLSKSKPLPYDLFEPAKQVLTSHAETDISWFVDVAAFVANGYDLDIKNPKGRQVAEMPTAQRCVSQLSTNLEEIKSRLHVLLEGIKSLETYGGGFRHVCLGDVTTERDERIGDSYTSEVRLVGVGSQEGITRPKTAIGKAADRYKIVQIGDLVYNPMRINIGSIGVALTDDHTGITSPDYVVFRCSKDILPEYVLQFLKSELGLDAIRQKTRGSVRFRLYYERLASIEIPIPEHIDVQKRLVDIGRELTVIKQRLALSCVGVDNAVTSLRRSVFSQIHAATV